LITDTY